MANQNIPQGTLNRLKASVVWRDFPQLNVTPPYLGKEAIRLAFEGTATLPINTMTGAVMSPEPYQVVRLTMSLLKSQFLADAYKAQMELNTLLGDATVRPDVAESRGLGPYQLTNCAIESVGELQFSGESAAYPVVCVGYYNINAALWN